MFSHTVKHCYSLLHPVSALLGVTEEVKVGGLDDSGSTGSRSPHMARMNPVPGTSTGMETFVFP